MKGDSGRINGERSVSMRQWLLTPFALLFLSGIAAIYVLGYLGITYLPGNSASPLGWWGWWDQSQYLRSAEAFANGNLDASQHWYPLGYSLLAAPFVYLAPLHAFFLIDLLSFLAFAVSLVWLSRLLRLGTLIGAVAFVAGVILPSFIFQQYVIPWTTVPTAALAAGCFVVYVICVQQETTRRRLVVVAVMASVLATIKPSDLLLLAPLFVHLLFRAVRAARQDAIMRPAMIKAVLSACLVGGIILGAYIALHLAIYGPHLSPYMIVSENIGFTWSAIPFKYAMIFTNPRPIWTIGAGIIERYPMTVLGIIGVVYATLFQRRYFGIAAAIWVTILMYLAYNDLLPANIWKFNGIHYFAWTFPVALLLFVAGVRDCFLNNHWWQFGLALVITTAMATISVGATETSVGVNTRVVGSTVTVDLRQPGEVAAIELSGSTGALASEDALDPDSIFLDGRHLEYRRDFALMHDKNTIRLILTRPRELRTLQVRLKSDPGLASGIAARVVIPHIALRAPWHQKNIEYQGMPRALSIPERAVHDGCPGQSPRYNENPPLDSQFLRVAYEAILGREPDPIGFSTGCKLLVGNAATRIQLLNGMLGSAEFRARLRSQPHPATDSGKKR